MNLTDDRNGKEINDTQNKEACRAYSFDDE